MYFTTDITSDFSIVGIVRDVKSIFWHLSVPGLFKRKKLKEFCLFFLSALGVKKSEREVFPPFGKFLLVFLKKSKVKN